MLYLRSKFSHIRVIVPQMAMSAATMIACAADAVVMGKHSYLGPIDPQIILTTQLGQRMVPAQAVLEQFERAQAECQDPARMGAWLPMLAQYGPHLLVQCQNASDMSHELVLRWLQTYMLKEDADGEAKATAIADWLSNHGHFKSHGRHVPRDELEQRGLLVEHLEDDQQTQDLFLSVFHATTHTFTGTRAVKVIENHLGKAFIKQARPMLIQVPGPPTGLLSPPAKPQDAPPTP